MAKANGKAAEVATKDAKVNGIIVSINQPYVEGHVITANEAKALNQTRTENIQNNTRKAVAAKLEEAGLDAESVTDEVKAAIQELVSSYDSEYEFAVRTAAASIVDPEEKEARRLVRENIKALLKQQDVKISDVDAAAIDAQIDAILDADDDNAKLFWKTAKENVARQAAVADIKLGELNLGG